MLHKLLTLNTNCFFKILKKKFKIEDKRYNNIQKKKLYQNALTQNRV